MLWTSLNRKENMCKDFRSRKGAQLVHGTKKRSVDKENEVQCRRS